MAFKARVIEEPAPERQSTFIDQGCELSGKLHFKESVRIEGKIDGEIRCDGTLHVGRSAVIEAKIVTAGIVIEEGARFKGEIVIGGDPPSAAKSSEKPAGGPRAVSA